MGMLQLNCSIGEVQVILWILNTGAQWHMCRLKPEIRGTGAFRLCRRMRAADDSTIWKN